VIVAEASPKGVGAISIVRLSGEGCIDIVIEVVRGLSNKSGIKPNKVYLVDITNNGDLIDKSTVVFYRKPRSYTGEDMVEIFCHGSPAVVASIIDIFVKKGARLAVAGEFTKRAFINGKIDIIEAEAINSLSRSLTRVGSSIAMSVLKGGLSERIEKVREDVLLLSATIEALIEYEDDVDFERLITDARTMLDNLIQTLEKMVSSFRSYSIASGGANVVIVGRKNSGKTTLFNHILGFERGIVSELPGTTRDYMRENIQLGDYQVNLTDIAGLGDITDELDILGVKVAKEVISDSDIVIFLVDITSGWGHIEDEIYNSIKDKEIIFIVSKIDIDESRVVNITNDIKDRTGLIPIPVSSFKSIGIDEMKRKIEKVINRLTEGEVFLITERQKDKVSEILNHLRRAYRMIEEGQGMEMVAEEVRYAVGSLEALVGKGLSDDVIDRIFSQFCVGK